MMIKESLYWPMANETILSEKLVPPIMRTGKDSRLNMSEKKNHRESFNTEAFYFNKEKSNRNRLISDPQTNNTITFSDSKELRETNTIGKKQKL